MAKLVLRIYIIQVYLAILYVIIYTKCLTNQQSILSKIIPIYFNVIKLVNIIKLKKKVFLKRIFRDPCGDINLINLVGIVKGFYFFFTINVNNNK